MSREALETVVGAFVLAVAALLIVFAYQSAGITVIEGYDVTASFQRVDGIRVGSDVRLSGIKVGSVVAEQLDPKTYFATLTLSIDRHVQLPLDTSAKIVTEGLMGGKYVALEPGADERMLKPGGQITHTQSSIDIQDLISRYMSGGAKEKPGEGGTQAP